MFRIRFEPSLCPCSSEHWTTWTGSLLCSVLTHLLSRLHIYTLHSIMQILTTIIFLVWFDLYNIFLIIYIFWLSIDLETRTPPLHTFCRSRVRKRVTNLEAAESGHARKYILISMATKVHSKVAFQFYAQDVNKRTFIWNTKYTKLKV